MHYPPSDNAPMPHPSLPPAVGSLHLHDGFVTDGTGLTYIGPLQDFPERYLTLVSGKWRW